MRNVRRQFQLRKLGKPQANAEAQKSSPEAETATRRTPAAGHAQRNRNFHARRIRERRRGPRVPLDLEEQKTK